MMSTDRGALADQAVLVTGASSGLGRATSLAAARAGADVILLARSEEDLHEVRAEVEALGRRALALPVDLADESSLVEGVRRSAQTFGRIDVLFNIAATDAPGPVSELSTEGWDRTIDVNLRAPFLLAREVYPHMREAGRGTIINVSSVAGKRGWANAAAYCASKFGLSGLTQALAAEG